jgi:hypothetical protein
VPDAAYPAAAELRKKFSFGWHTFKVAGAASAMAVDDIEAELASRQLRTEQLVQMKENLRAECQQFASDYVMAFRKEVAEFCDQVIDAGGKVHGKTLQAIRRKIEHFHAMNIFNDAETAAQLRSSRIRSSASPARRSRSSRTWRRSSARPAPCSSRNCSIRIVCRLSPAG